jgi:hypothetical protein
MVKPEIDPDAPLAIHILKSLAVISGMSAVRLQFVGWRETRATVKLLHNERALIYKAW